ncbi:MAG: chorismate mutase [Acidimicrobiales bacterium]
MPVRALRGATTVDDDTAEEVRSRVGELVLALLERNGLGTDDLISLFVTATADLHSFHPATAARACGLGEVAILGAQELVIDGSLPKCVRLLAHVEIDRPRDQLRHVYLHGAVALRPDLAARS